VEEGMKEEDLMYGDWLLRRTMASYVEWRNFEPPAERRAAIEAIRLEDFVN
jgi:hypothetical protein